MTRFFAGLSADAGDFTSRNGARLSLSVDAVARSGCTESKLIFYDANSGGIREHVTVDWKVVSLTHARRAGTFRTWALGEDGRSGRRHPEGTSVEG